MLVSTDDRSANSSEENTTLTELARVVDKVDMLFETGFCPMSKTTCWQLLMKSEPFEILLLLWSALQNLVEVMSVIVSKTPYTASLF